MRLLGLLRVRETELLGDLAAFLLDLREVLHPEVVHALRLERQRRPREDLRRVEVPPVGERPESDRLGRGRGVVAQDAEVVLVGGHDLVADDVEHVRARVGSVFCDRHQRGGVLRRHREEALHLRDRPLDHDLRHRLSRDPVEAGEVLLQPLGRVGALERAEVREDLSRSEEMRHRGEAVPAVFDLHEVAPGRGREDVERGPQVEVELSGRERVRHLERFALERLPARAALVGDVRQPVVEALVADLRAEDRLELEDPVPVPIDEAECFFGGVLHRRSSSLGRAFHPPTAGG